MTGCLHIDLKPTVVAAAARRVPSVTLCLHDEGWVRFRDRVQIGRCRAREGFWSGSVHADRNGRPLPRHRVELGAESLANDAISAPHAAINELRYPATGFETIAIDEGSTVLVLADDGS